MVYETQFYTLGKKYKAAHRNQFVRYKEFIYVILNNIRCIRPVHGYELLETPLVSGLQDEANDNVHSIEVLLDSGIKERLMMLLRKSYYVENARDYISEIKKSETYRMNIDFIVAYHKHLKDGVSADMIESKYQQLMEELLSLLENKDYSDYLKEKIHEIESSDIWYKQKWGEEFSYHHMYNIIRFPQLNDETT